MQITLREALSFGGLIDAEVLAGGKNLDNKVDSATTIEVTEDGIASWVWENQLYISAMYSVKDDVERQLKLIRILNENKCSGLVLCHIGIWMKKISPKLIKLCEKLDFPLIKANPNTQYIDILSPLLFRTVGDKVKYNDHEIKLNNELLDYIIDENDWGDAFERITEKYRMKITYLDPYCNCLYSNKSLETMELDKNYVRSKINEIFTALLNNHYYIKEDDVSEELIYLVKTKKTTLGFLMITIDKKNEFENIVDVAETLSVLFALISGRKTWILHMKNHYVEEYITDLLFWNFASEEAALKRGQDLGINIIGKNVFAIININGFNKLTNEKRKTVSEKIEENIIPKIKDRIYALDKTSVLVFRNDQILMITDTADDYENFVKVLKKCNSEVLVGNALVSIGISDPFEKLNEIPKAYKQAFNAFTIGREFIGNNIVVDYNKVFFFNKINENRERSDAKSHAMQLIKPLIAYDTSHNSTLVRTLKALVKNNNDITKTSEELYLHRNTVLYRKNRIEKILGYSPFDMPYYINFFIALIIIE